MIKLKPSKILTGINTILKTLASQSTCQRSKCSSVIVYYEDYETKQIRINGEFNRPYILLGAGYNSMPQNKVGKCFKDDLPANFKSDRTCCVHAEQRAILNAFGQDRGHYYIKNSILFFQRYDLEGNIIPAGLPYCTICSKMALDVGIAYFCLYHKKGWTAYDTREYNDLSFAFNGDKCDSEIKSDKGIKKGKTAEVIMSLNKLSFDKI